MIGVGPLSGLVYAGNVRTYPNGQRIFVGNKRDVTQSFIGAMLAWITFENEDQDDENGTRTIRTDEMEYTITCTAKKLRKKAG
jgi:hypothetical protein